MIIKHNKTFTMSIGHNTIFKNFNLFFIKVIDGYLKILCQTELDKGQLILHVPVQTMTAISTGKYFNDQSSKIFSKVSKEQCHFN